ncbi:MAG: acyltransferase [Burkholderiales bacterium]
MSAVVASDLMRDDAPDVAARAAAAPAHLPGLDGLRGLAILLVVPHNLLPASEATGWVSHAVMSVLERGWVGVQLFFALSGFLITGILLDTRRCDNSLRVFFARRVLRIFPLYYLMLVVMLVLLPALHWPPNGHATAPAVLHSYWLYLSNWVSPYHQGEGVLPHLWSLAVEEQFYLVWPFLVGGLRARGVMVLAMGLTIASLLVRLWMLAHGQPPEAVYQFTICRIDALVMGGAAAAALREPQLARALALQWRRVAWAALAALLLGALVSRGYRPFGASAQTLGYLMLSIGSALVVLAVAQHDQRVREGGAAGLRWLRAPWLQRCGHYSYGMYMWHVPLAAMLGYPLLAHFGLGRGGVQPPAWVWGGYIVLGAVLTYGLAWCSYHAVERHFLAWKPRYRTAV